MKKQLILLTCFTFAYVSTQAQVGVGTSTPKAALDIQSTNAGVLIPRISLTNLNSAFPVENPNTNNNALEVGTLIFNTNTTIGRGFYYWDGSKWVAIQGNATNTDKNTLDQAYDQGGAGVGRNIIADAGAVTILNNNANDDGMFILNNSNTSGIAGQTTNIYKANQIAVSSILDNTGTGVNFYADDYSLNNPYSAIQVNGASNSNTYAGVKSTVSGTADAIRAVNTSTGLALRTENSGTGGAFYAFSRGNQATATIIGNTNVPNVLEVNNQRTNAGAAIDAVGAIGLRTTSNTAGGVGVISYLNATSGAAGGFNATGNNILEIRTPGAANTLRAGIGAKGNSVGSYGEFTLTTGTAFSGFSSAYNIYTYFCAVIGGSYYDAYRTNNANTSYFANVIGSGSNVTTIEHKNKTHVMAAISAPQDLFQDFGTGQLQNGRVRINLDPILSSNILVDENNPIKIFVQLEGECNGVYVTNKSATGFDVVELNQGQSNTSFSYSISATRKAQKLVTKDNTIQTIDYSKRFRSLDLKPKTLEILDSNSDTQITEIVQPAPTKVLPAVIINKEKLKIDKR